MFLGRSTVQWTALFTAAGGLAQLLIVQFVRDIDPTVVASIIGAAIAFLGAFIAFLANTATTPIGDPRLKSGTVVTVLDPEGKPTTDTVTIEETPPGPTGTDGAVS